MSTTIGLNIRRVYATHPTGSLYTAASLRRQARQLAGTDAILAATIEVLEGDKDAAVTLVVEHRSRAGDIKVSRCRL